MVHHVDGIDIWGNDPDGAVNHIIMNPSDFVYYDSRFAEFDLARHLGSEFWHTIIARAAALMSGCSVDECLRVVDATANRLNAYN